MFLHGFCTTDRHAVVPHQKLVTTVDVLKKSDEAQRLTSFQDKGQVANMWPPLHFKDINNNIKTK